MTISRFCSEFYDLLFSGVLLLIFFLFNNFFTANNFFRSLYWNYLRPEIKICSSKRILIWSCCFLMPLPITQNNLNIFWAKGLVWTQDAKSHRTSLYIRIYREDFSQVMRFEVVYFLRSSQCRCGMEMKVGTYF